MAPGPTSTTRLLHAAQGVLLDLADDAALRAVAAGWKDRVVVTTATAQADALGAAPALLVRPDGYVVWAGTDAGAAGLEAALVRWFGRPRPSAA